MSTSHKIISLEISNVKRIKTLFLKPDGNTVIIGGKNDSGKSSTLDSIWYALGGGKAIPDKPLRKGAKKGHVRIDLGELEVERRFTEAGSVLAVKYKDGRDAKSPQAVLDTLCGKLTFDPLAFSRLKAAEQMAVVRDLCGLDFTALDQEAENAYGARTSANREAKQLAAELGGLDFHDDAPKAETSMTELVAELEKATAANAGNDNRRGAVASCKTRLDAAQDRVNELRRQFDKAVEIEAECAREYREAMAEANDLIDVPTDPIKLRMQTVEATNSKVRANAKYAEVETKLAAVKARSEGLTERLDAIEDEKAALVAAAELPIEGLGFALDGLTFKGLPFEQASSAQRIAISAAMGMALSPDLRIMLIHDGSLLDADSLAALETMAQAQDYQIWIERVGGGAECAVILEDGAAKAETVIDGAGVGAEV